MKYTSLCKKVKVELDLDELSSESLLKIEELINTLAENRYWVGVQEIAHRNIDRTVRSMLERGSLMRLGVGKKQKV